MNSQLYLKTRKISIPVLHIPQWKLKVTGPSRRHELQPSTSPHQWQGLEFLLAESVLLGMAVSCLPAIPTTAPTFNMLFPCHLGHTISLLASLGPQVSPLTSCIRAQLPRVTLSKTLLSGNQPQLRNLQGLSIFLARIA